MYLPLSRQQFFSQMHLGAHSSLPLCYTYCVPAKLEFLSWIHRFSAEGWRSCALTVSLRQTGKAPYFKGFRLSGKVFHPFPTRKIKPRSSYIVGGVILTTKTKYRLGGLSACPRNQDISSEKKKCPFFVPKIQYRQEENNAGENHAERAWYARTDSCCSETEAPQPYSASLSMCQLRGDEYGSSVFSGWLHR